MSLKFLCCFIQLFGSNGVCPSIDSFNKNHDQIVNNIIESDENIKSLMSYLSEKCGQPITGKNVLKLYDLFVCQVNLKYY